jgi:hypothetical protein
MFLIPLFIIILAAVSILVSPIFAVIVFVIGFVGYLGLAMLSRGEPEEVSGAGPDQRAAMRGRQEAKKPRLR